MGVLKWLFRGELWQKGYFYFKDKGFKKALGRFAVLAREKVRVSRSPVTGDEERYEQWWKSQELDTEGINGMKKKAEMLKYKPVISVLVPVYNTPSEWLEKCLRSVEEQIYPYWELCVVDDSSKKEFTRETLARWKNKAEKDRRIKISRQKENLHISLTTNNCLKLAAGEYVALLDHDDTLHPAALYLAAKKLNDDRDLDFIYSDEDKLDEHGRHCDPYFKSDWNPDLLLSVNYICHLSVIRKSLMEKLGGMRKGFEGSQDYDLFLRLAENTGKIAHIPHILYHWRKIKGSTSFSYQSKGYADKASILALKDAGRRRPAPPGTGKEKWKVEKGLATCSFRVKRSIRNKQKVSIIIPFRDKMQVLRRCVESILEKTDYPNYELVLVDNDSKEPEMLKYLEKCRNAPGRVPTEKKVKILKYPHPFNFSAINNWAVGKVDSSWILFLNNDISIINKGWLSAMVEHIQRPEVGAVGAKLLYPNGMIQHAGVILGVGKFKNKPCGMAGHAFKYFPRGSHGYFEQIDVIRNYSAVTAACMLTRKDVFEKLGGFDKKNFSVAWNDVDYCLRLRKKGYLIVYTPYARLYHHESLSRGSDERGDKLKRFHRECEEMYRRWENILAKDPYYNPNLSLEDESFRIRKKADVIA